MTFLILFLVFIFRDDYEVWFEYIRPSSKDIKHKACLCKVVPRARDNKCKSHCMYMRSKTCKTEGGEMKDWARLQ